MLSLSLFDILDIFLFKLLKFLQFLKPQKLLLLIDILVLCTDLFDGSREEIG